MAVNTVLLGGNSFGGTARWREYLGGKSTGTRSSAVPRIMAGLSSAVRGSTKYGGKPLAGIQFSGNVSAFFCFFGGILSLGTYIP